MFFHLVLFTLAATPTTRVAWGGIRAQDVDPDLATLAARVLAISISGAGVEWVKPEAALDCATDPLPCSASVSKQLGIDGYLTGTLKQSAGVTEAMIVVLDTSGHPIATHPLRSRATWTLVQEFQKLGPAIAEELSRSSAKPLHRETALHRWSPWLIGTGAGVTGAGAVLLVLSAANHQHLVDISRPGLELLNSTPADAVDTARAGRREQLFGAVAVGVGLAALGTGLAIRILEPTISPKMPSLGFDPTRHTVVLTGVLP